MTQIVSYKIKNTETGLFLRTGYRLFWSKKGRTWTALHHLRSSLRTILTNLEPTDNIDHWVVVEYSLVPTRETNVRNI